MKTTITQNTNLYTLEKREKMDQLRNFISCVVDAALWCHEDRYHSPHAPRGICPWCGEFNP